MNPPSRIGPANAGRGDATRSGNPATPAIRARRPVLVTGGAGFIGSNLADRLASGGEDVLVLDSLARPGVEGNLAWLKARHRGRISAAVADIRDPDALAETVREASAVFHLAAQVAVTTSLAEPAEDFAVNLGGTVALLEALRKRPVPLLFASTNKVYGNLADVQLTDGEAGHMPRNERIRRYGVDERRPLDFQTPYGCSKGGADQYVLDYARSFGLPATVMRMSCVYGERQFGTEDQGWVAHFLVRALNGETVTIFGDGQQVRDVLHVGDAVAAYVAARDNIGSVAGRAFNLGGGPDNAVSLNRVLAEASAHLGGSIRVDHAEWRPGDQRWFVSDIRAVRAALGLAPPLPWRAGIARLFRWLAGERQAAARVGARDVRPSVEVQA